MIVQFLRLHLLILDLEHLISLSSLRISSAIGVNRLVGVIIRLRVLILLVDTLLNKGCHDALVQTLASLLQ